MKETKQKMIYNTKQKMIYNSKACIKNHLKFQNDATDTFCTEAV